MNAVILAAGIASRLRPLTDHTPKCLLPIGGTTILEHTIGNLLANDVRDIVIVTGYLEEQIRAYVAARFPSLPVTFIHNDVFDSTNNIYSLWLTRPRTEHDAMLLLDSDIIFDPRIIGALRDSGRADCLAVRADGGVGEEEIKVRIDDARRVLALNKQVPVADAYGESIGIELFSREWVEELFRVLERKMLVNGEVNQFYEKAFEEMIASGRALYAVNIDGFPCIEIDTAADFTRAERDVLPRIGSMSGAG
jgi:choline kinase